MNLMFSTGGHTELTFEFDGNALSHYLTLIYQFNRKAPESFQIELMNRATTALKTRLNIGQKSYRMEQIDIILRIPSLNSGYAKLEKIIVDIQRREEKVQIYVNNAAQGLLPINFFSMCHPAESGDLSAVSSCHIRKRLMDSHFVGYTMTVDYD